MEIKNTLEQKEKIPRFLKDQSQADLWPLKRRIIAAVDSLWGSPLKQVDGKGKVLIEGQKSLLSAQAKLQSWAWSHCATPVGRCSERSQKQLSAMLQCQASAKPALSSQGINMPWHKSRSSDSSPVPPLQFFVTSCHCFLVLEEKNSLNAIWMHISAPTLLFPSATATHYSLSCLQWLKLGPRHFL